MQGTKLHVLQESAQRSEPYGAAKVLFALPDAYVASGDEIGLYPGRIAIRPGLVQASSSIWQSNGLQNRRLRVQFLPGLPGKRTPSHGEYSGTVSSSVEKQGPKEREYVAKSVAEKKTGENRVFRYFRETYYELKRVSWPTRSEALNLTVIVIVVTMTLAVILGLMDAAFSEVFALFFSAVGA